MRRGKRILSESTSRSSNAHFVGVADIDEVQKLWGASYRILQVAEHCIALIHSRSMEVSMHTRQAASRGSSAQAEPQTSPQPVFLIQYARHYPFDAPLVYTLQWGHLLCGYAPWRGVQGGSPGAQLTPPCSKTAAPLHASHIGTAVGQACIPFRSLGGDLDDEGDVSLAGRSSDPPSTLSPHECSPGKSGLVGFAHVENELFCRISCLVAPSICSPAGGGYRRRQLSLPEPAQPLALQSVADWSCVRALVDIVNDVAGTVWRSEQ